MFLPYFRLFKVYASGREGSLLRAGNVDLVKLDIDIVNGPIRIN